MMLAAVCLFLALGVLTWPPRPGIVPRRGAPPTAQPCSDDRSAPSGPARLALRAGGSPGYPALPRAWARRQLRREDGLEELAEFAELLALCLRSGLPPREALQIARQDTPSTHPRVVSTADRLAILHEGVSGPAPPVVSVTDADSSLVLAAWMLGLDCGAPLTEAVDEAARALRDKAAARRRATTARAGPKATMWLLTALPVAGPLAALAVGSDLAATFGRPLAVLSLAVGLTFTAMGWWWSRWLLRRAEAATVYG